MLDKISRKHYIQCALTVLMTGIILWLSAFLWSSKSVTASFVSQSEHDMEYKVYYAQNYKDSFSKKRTVTKKVEAGDQKIIFDIPVKNLAKFRLEINKNPGKFVLSDITVKGSKTTELEGKKFKQNQIDKYEVKNGEIIIVSKQKKPYIEYKENLNLNAGLRIDWCNLIIISVMVFLFAYKFVQYLSKFKIEKHHLRIDIVMLTLFFALLFVPMSHISDATKSEQEKRMLAKKPVFLINGKVNYNYGPQFDAWYNDHFFGRDMMIGLYNKASSINNVMENKIVYYDKKSKWIFHKAKYNVRAKEEKKDDVLKALKKVNDFAKSHNIKFYLFIVPNKTDIYSKLHPLYTKEINALFYDYIDYFKKNADFPIIYPLDELKEASKNDYVYFKRSHHWTEWGAYNGYKTIINTVKHDFDNVKTVSEDDYKISYDHKIKDDWDRIFRSNSTAMGLHISDNEKYKYYTPVNKIETKITDKPKYKVKLFKNDNVKNDLKVILTGTSNNENLLQFLPYSFRELKYIRLNTVKAVKPGNKYKLMERYKKDILDFKPDLLIISVVADNIPGLVDLATEK